MNSPTKQTRIFGIEIDHVSLPQAVQQIRQWCGAQEYLCRYVVTPNLDHAVQFQGNAELRAAYAKAALVVADGWPLVSASRLFDCALPERVAGADLVPALLASGSSANPLSVFLLGAAEGVGRVAADNIRARWPAVQIAGTCSPKPGFQHDVCANQKIVRQINACQPDLLVVCFGAPKQEIWLSQHHDQLRVGVAIAAGATIDFLAGRQHRAPSWVRHLRLEWTHRLLTNPRRLAGRYARNAWQLPGLLYQEYRSRQAAGHRTGFESVD